MKIKLKFSHMQILFQNQNLNSDYQNSINLIFFKNLTFLI